jgi:hypothetical protein
MEVFGNGIPVFGEADDRTLNPIRVCTRTAGTLALLPDHHLGRSLDGSPFLRTYSPFGAQTEVNECIALKS